MKRRKPARAPRRRNHADPVCVAWRFDDAAPFIATLPDLWHGRFDPNTQVRS